MENQDEVNKAKEEVARAGRRLFDVLYAQIKERYLSVSEDKRQIIISGLENLLADPLREKGTGLIDSDQAREIRQKAGLTQRELAKILGINSGQNLFSLYERGKIKRPESSKYFKKYFVWLKENGYSD